MKTKLLKLSSALMLAATALAFVASPVAADDASCRNLGPSNHYWTVRNLQASAGKDFNSVVTNIDINPLADSFSICGYTAIDWDDNGALVWNAIVPSIDTPEFGNPNAIFQIGITRCASVGTSACFGDTAAPHYFWAGGGCTNSGGSSGNGEVPDPIDLGPADFNPHQFKVQKGSGAWYVYIDGVAKANLTYTVGSRISCWAADPDIKGQMGGEKWDTGDSIGNATGVSTFDSIVYRYVGDTNYIAWTPPAGTTCSTITQGYDHCHFPTPEVGRFYIWTDQP